MRHQVQTLIAPGYLYMVDTQTGQLTEIGSTGLSGIQSLTFHPDGSSLWGWVNDEGLVEINPQTAESELILPYQGKIKDLTWDADGIQLYAIEDTNLWVYDGQTAKKACDVSKESKTLETLPGNMLLLGIYEENSPQILQAINVNTCEAAAQQNISTDKYTNVKDFACMTPFGN
jgi:hypothetical protein